MIYRKGDDGMNEKTKATMLKYRKNSREQIQVDMAKGMKAKIKAYADKNGVSMSALILRLLETEMAQDAEFCSAWQDKIESERAEQDAVKQAEINRIKSENAAAMLDSLK